MYKLESNQYIPYRSKSLPSGYPACATYYYLVDTKGNTLDKATLKPYKGKQMDRYAMHSKTEAEAYLEVINKAWTRKSGLERYPEFNKLVNTLADGLCKQINLKAKKIESNMPYKTQFVLEEIIKILEERV